MEAKNKTQVKVDAKSETISGTNDGDKVHREHPWEVIVERVVGSKYTICTANDDIVENSEDLKF